MVRDKVVNRDDMFGIKTTMKASEVYTELDELWKKREVYANLAWACEEAVKLDDYFEDTKIAGQLWAETTKELAKIDSRADKLCDMLLDNGYDPVINPFEDDE